MKMEMLTIPAVIALAICFRLIAGSMNHKRIRQYIESLGGHVENIKWKPFGPGWFGEKSQVIYRVLYVDSQGAHHDAYCKTSLFTGVYFTEDIITSQSPHARQTESLEEENRRLRLELETLKRKSREDDWQR